MTPIADPILARIFATCADPELPHTVVEGAHWLIHLLLAARSWSTIDAFAEIYRSDDQRFVAMLDEHWGISFDWDAGSSRVYNARLERL
jgi:hypothetical protein